MQVYESSYYNPIITQFYSLMEVHIRTQLHWVADGPTVVKLGEEMVIVENREREKEWSTEGQRCPLVCRMVLHIVI
jgi:hypothetical protein